MLRYRELVDDPVHQLDQIFAFLGVEAGLVQEIPSSNMSGWAEDSTVNSALRRAISLGAAAGSYVDPRVWRQAQRPLVATLRRDRTHRPSLAPEQRRRLVEHFRDDVALLETLLGRDFQDWVGDTGRGTYAVRRS